jgi:phage recombination protein Bet
MAIMEGRKMSTALTIVNGMDRDKVELIKQTVAKGASDLELELFMHACKRTGLDPLMKQIYAIKRWNSAEKKEVMAFQTGIDGYRLIADRTNRYAPGRAPEFQYNEHHEVISATAYVKKQTVDGEWHECSATAYWDEYVQTTKDGKPTSMWLKMPHLMLAKCAEALALRQAFPAELSGVYTHEEMMQADNEPRMVKVEAPQLPTAEPTVESGAQPPVTDSTTNFGVFIWQYGPKFKGYQIVDIPYSNLEWFMTNEKTPDDHKDAARMELDRRDAAAQMANQNG